MKISLLGPVGTGKGTQAQRLSEALNWTRIATGDLIRDQIEADTELGRELKHYSDRGEPAPDEDILQLVSPHLQPAGGWILDDCPRTIKQARMLDEELKNRGIGLDRVIFLEGPSDEELIERVSSGRRISMATGRVYHLENDPPPDPNEGKDPGPFVQRDDDTEEALRRQLESWREEAEEIKEHYDEQGILTVIDAGREVPEITEEIIEALGQSAEEVGLHLYSDPASERHVNHMAGVESPERFPAALAGVEEAERAGVDVERQSCEPAPRSALEAVHAPAYLDRLEELAASGGGYVDFDTALNADSWEAATRASGAAMGAVESALAGTAAFAIARPPGHHAGRSYGMGFCLLNNVAVAAEHARSSGAERVAILDWDVHHGNGTQDIFYATGDVLYLSVHQSPFYPGTGDAREIGEGRGRGFTANVPMPGRSGEGVYAEAFAGFFVPILREYRAELLLVSAGYDAHSDDLLGGMRLESASFGRFAARLAALTREIGAAPPVFLLEGGYNLNALTESVAATITGVEEQPPAWEYSGDVRQVEAARKNLSPFWESLR